MKQNKLQSESRAERIEREEKWEREQKRKKIAERRKRAKRRRRQQIFARAILLVLLLLVIAGGISLVQKLKNRQSAPAQMTIEQTKYIEASPGFKVELLTPNEYSRPQLAIDTVNGIVIHYTANPGTTAEQNRSYFESLAQTKETYASSHFVIGIEGEIIQCIPCNEIAYASNDRNNDTISIECCIPDDSGKFTDATYESLTELTAWLMGRYDLTNEQVIRHYDVTGKNCPKYYVENPDAWSQFKEDLLTYFDTYGIEKKQEIN